MSKANDLKAYLALLSQFLDTPFSTSTLLHWLAPSAVQLGQQPLPPDGAYYIVQEKVLILRAAKPVSGVIWWPSTGPQDPIHELHITPTTPGTRYEDWAHSLPPGPERGRHQGHPLADIEHRFRLHSPKGNILELTLQEIVFPPDSGSAGFIGGVILKKVGAGPLNARKAPVQNVPAPAAPLPETLQHHLLIGRWKAVDENQGIADVIDFEAARGEPSGQKGPMFRTYGRQGLIDEGVWALQGSHRLRFAWKSGLIRSFDLMVKGDRLILRDKSGQFRYRRKGERLWK